MKTTITGEGSLAFTTENMNKASEKLRIGTVVENNGEEWFILTYIKQHGALPSDEELKRMDLSLFEAGLRAIGFEYGWENGIVYLTGYCASEFQPKMLGILSALKEFMEPGGIMEFVDNTNTLQIRFRATTNAA